MPCIMPATHPRMSTPKVSLKKTNDIPLTREFLLVVLGDLSTRIQLYFGSMAPVNLVIHGGSVMVLHNELESRQYTLDIDYCHRGFVAEWTRRGLYDADARLRKCIAETAERFDLGEDWMNDHADVVLPYTRRCVANVCLPLPSRCSIMPCYSEKSRELYDYVWHASMERPNVHNNTVYRSKALNLVAPPWAWCVALKLVRFEKNDPYDVACILTRGRQVGAVRQWDTVTIEKWLSDNCGVMGYARYNPQQVIVMRQRMNQAIVLAQTVEKYGKAQSMAMFENHRHELPPPPPTTHVVATRTVRVR